MATLKKIKKVMSEKIRPYAQMHGGDIEVVELTKNNILKVRLLGTCNGCSMSTVTLQYGVQEMLFQEFPNDDIGLEVVI
ncbi:MAG: NifU family protein [Patescibacteria group bacterium]